MTVFSVGALCRDTVTHQHLSLYVHFICLFVSEVKQEEPSASVWLVSPVRKQVKFLFVAGAVINVRTGLLTTIKQS